MRRRTQQPVLQVLTESIVDGKGNDERSDSGGNSSDRYARDHADDSLAAFGTEVASRDEEFEAHNRSYQLMQLDSIIARRFLEVSSGPYPGHDSRHLSLIIPVFLAESLLKFLFFQSDHDCARGHGEDRQPVADHQAGSEAPGQHLA